MVERLQGAGAYTVRIPAEGWASGLYVYVLEADGKRLTGKMIVTH